MRTITCIKMERDFMLLHNCFDTKNAGFYPSIFRDDDAETSHLVSAKRHFPET